VTREELLNSLTNTRHSRRIGTVAAKLLSLDQLMQVGSPIHGNGSRVVFTNGCFNLLHAGHVQFLEYAKELGDVLVVGLNSDSSIVETKGSGRPVICEEQRVKMLSALSCVNFVVVFSDPTPTSLIETILPDVLVKGDGYTLDQVVGAEMVKAAGGRVGLVQRVEGLSTTSIIRRIMQRNGTGE
jgi:rfaE bifunctional protein nucleotidyltransferase chain/domain